MFMKSIGEEAMLFFRGLVGVAGSNRLESRLIIDVENERDAERFEDVVLMAVSLLH
jgi:hypothetical protein